jgi:hypothetical protein
MRLLETLEDKVVSVIGYKTRVEAIDGSNRPIGITTFHGLYSHASVATVREYNTHAYGVCLRETTTGDNWRQLAIRGRHSASPITP